MQVVSDAGALELSEVFNLIKEGEALPIQFDKEMEVQSMYTLEIEMDLSLMS